MLITLLNVAAIVLLILGLLVLFGVIAINNASGVGLLVAAGICAVVAWFLARGRVA